MQLAVLRNESGVSVIKQTGRRCSERKSSFMSQLTETDAALRACLLLDGYAFRLIFFYELHMDISLLILSPSDMMSFLPDHKYLKAWGTTFFFAEPSDAEGTGCFLQTHIQ